MPEGKVHVEEWRMEGWKGGRGEDWKSGRLEEWWQILLMLFVSSLLGAASGSAPEGAKTVNRR